MNRRSFLKMLGIGVAVAAVAPAAVKAEPPIKFQYEIWDATGTKLKGHIPHHNPEAGDIFVKPKGLPYLIQNSGTYHGLHRAKF